MSDDRETITSLRYTLASSGSNDPVLMVFQDLDGNGGNPPVIEGGTLAANSIYFGTLELFDEGAGSTLDLTEEIEAEKGEHQFFFTIQGLDMTVIYADADNDGNPVGLFTAVNTGNAGSGTLIINLQHGLNKFGAGVKEGQINNAGGKTDIQVSFPIVIQ